MTVRARDGQVVMIRPSCGAIAHSCHELGNSHDKQAKAKYGTMKASFQVRSKAWSGDAVYQITSSVCMTVLQLVSTIFLNSDL